MNRAAMIGKYLLVLGFVFCFIFPQAAFAEPPSLEIQKILAADAETLDKYGDSVAIEGDYAVIGAWDDFPDGAAYIFNRTGPDTWDTGTKILAPDGDSGDKFGLSVSIDGDYVIVGAPEEDAGGSNAGAAYIFRRTGTNTWDGGTKIVAADAKADNKFGLSVAIDGDYAIVGTPEETGGSDAGAAYIFRRIEINTWDTGTKIVAADAEADDSFGRSVAIRGDYAVIGAYFEDTGASNAGAAYIFHRTGTNIWDSGTKIMAADAEADDNFGRSVAIDGDYTVVSAYNEDAGGTDAGAAYIFLRTGTNTWDTGTKIVAADAEAGDQFGRSVSISGDYTVVGAYNEDTAASNAGAAYIFHRTGSNTWDGGTKIMAADADVDDNFGRSVAIDGDYAVVGAPGEDAGGTDAGAAYIFVKGIRINAVSGDTSEGGTQATFTVRLNTQPTANVTIAVSSSDTGEGTVSPSSLIFTNANWNGDQTVTVTGVDDALVDGDIAYSIVLGAAVSADLDFSGSDPDDVSLNNVDDETPGFTISAISGNTGEDGTQATFTVRLNKQPTANVTIGVSSSDVGEGTVSPSILTFTNVNWNANQTVTVTGVDDAIADGNQSYSAVLAAAASSDGGYNGLNPADVSVTNVDNDSPGFTISAISGDTDESGTTAFFTVVLNSAPTADVIIQVSSSDTGEGTVDKSSLTFTNANWNADQTVTVTGVDDAIVDGNQIYRALLPAVTSSDVTYNGLNPPNVFVTNIDDDSPGYIISAISGNTSEDEITTATFTVRLNKQPTADVTIGVSSSDTGEGTVSPSSLTFTNANWNAPQIVTVTGVDDVIVDGNQAYNAVLAAAVSTDTDYSGLDPADVSVTNVDDDSPGFTISAISGDTGEGGATATFTVKLTSQPAADVTIGVSSSDTGEGTVSPSSLTFTNANWNAPQIVTVTGVDDVIVDGNQAYNAVLAAAVSSDTNYSGLDPADVSVTNVDDDSPGFTIGAISGNSGEDGTTATFTLKLTSQPAANVTIGVSSSDTGEGTVDKASLTFTNANWNANQTVTVTGVDDLIIDGNQVYSIVLAAAVSSDTDYSGLDPADVSVTNVDDDSAGFTISAISGNTGEDGTTATFTVKLTFEPTADVTIGVSSSDTGEGTISPSSLTFTNLNWNTNQTVTVTGVDDAIADGNQAYNAVLAAAVSSDAFYDGLDPSDVPVINTDIGETAGFIVSVISGNTKEDGTIATFTVQLTSQPTDDVATDMVSSNTDEGTVSPSSLTFTNANWNVLQTVTVTGVDDTTVDGSQDFFVELVAALSNDAAYNGIDPADVTVTNEDNDYVRRKSSSGGCSTTASMATGRGLDLGILLLVLLPFGLGLARVMRNFR